ncbi:hypothetical protein FRB96_008310 [Tulasnella sp. 330]|nr:hypothetical protein FRB96_008310 [Tulasnella sp. 330]KAG8886178.1 hypothetical protein FRB97_007216 [Tulasnella sp. 331]KAG8890419.1 hypothetical protein FRB98_008454 [Tulasnella sp. 332]
MSAVKKQLIIFDFDWSMADQDTDRWVLEVLSLRLRRKMQDLRNDVQWTDLVAQMMVELHEEGRTKQEVLDALRSMPFHPAMVRAIKSLKGRPSPETTFLCLSNANQVYIDTILEARGLTHIFDEIITNPATWTDDGLLQVRRRINPSAKQHSCHVGCSPNMCKGEELEAYLSRKGGLDSFEKLIYIGDGSNDFCPILRLREKDLALARTQRGLERRIKEEGAEAGLKSQVKYWVGAWEVEEVFAAH